MNLRNIAISNIKSSGYHCIISLINKNEAIHLMQTCDLTKKKPVIIKCKNFLSHIKMSKKVLTFGNTEIEKKFFYRHKTPIFGRECRY